MVPLAAKLLEVAPLEAVKSGFRLPQRENGVRSFLTTDVSRRQCDRLQFAERAGFEPAVTVF